jgi:predicted O-methyltransferase YrrM
MLLLRQASVDRISALTGVGDGDLRTYRRELSESPLPDLLLQRGAGLPFARELPQAALLYLMVRSLRPRRVIETGVRPGYSTAWILSAIERNGSGELTSLGPGPTSGRSPGVHDVTVGQFVAPSLRGAWTLVLGNTEDHLREILHDGEDVDLFFFDNGPDVQRARFELRTAWSALSPRGVLMAHHIDANSAWTEFCRTAGVSNQPFDLGPPPMGALGMGSRHP